MKKSYFLPVFYIVVLSLSFCRAATAQTAEWVSYLDYRSYASQSFSNQDYHACVVLSETMCQLKGSFVSYTDMARYTIALVMDNQSQKAGKFLIEFINHHGFNRNTFDFYGITFDTLLLHISEQPYYTFIDSLSRAKKPKCAIFIDSLVSMVSRDQFIRQQHTEFMSTTPVDRIEHELLMTTMQNIDYANQTQLKEFITIYGFPTWELVGLQGSYNAWLIAQHAPLDFQEWYLENLEEAVLNDNALPANLAYLRDRVNTRNRIPQCYGTQGWSNGTYRPIEDFEHLNLNREMMFLPPMDVKNMKIEEKY